MKSAPDYAFSVLNNSGIKMEHRLSMRKRVTVDVSIYREAFPVVYGRTRDIGLEGMYVETEPVTFPEGTTLEVEFTIKINNSEQRTRQFCLPAFVIHRAGKGMGLMFTILTPALFETVLKLDS